MTGLVAFCKYDYDYVNWYVQFVLSWQNIERTLYYKRVSKFLLFSFSELKIQELNTC